MGSRISLTNYLSAREDVLSGEDVAAYLQLLSENEQVLSAAMLGADREASRKLSPKEQIDNAHIASGHIINFLRARNLPNEGMQQLGHAQYRYALDQASSFGGKNG